MKASFIPAELIGAGILLLAVADCLPNLAWGCDPSAVPGGTGIPWDGDAGDDRSL